MDTRHPESGSNPTGEGANGSAMVRFERVSKTFTGGPTPVLAVDGVSLEIRAGEFFTLLGSSGCGKTTLLRMLGGFETPTAGRIHLGGEDVTDIPPHRRPVNTVFQNYALFPHRTVAGNIAFGLEMLGRSKSEIAHSVGALLKLVQMDGLGDRRIDQLSGGQQQRVAFARALAPGPKVLLLDEPLSALDAKLRKEMRAELRRLKQATGLTFVFVTHDQEEALTMSDRIGVMHQGRLLQVGTPTEIYDRPVSRFVAQFVGETNLLSAELVEVRGQVGVVRLPGGPLQEVLLPEGDWTLGKVTVAVRPEFVRLGETASGIAMTGTVESVDYLGTALQVRLRMEDGGVMTARLQAEAMPMALLPPGAMVPVSLEPKALRMVRDTD
ncbi:MAG: ABC transporter ATP-binding protein [Verrucomicrobiales bacterium]|nr:ABC transporter ATP-binding protein [Verrucomicrobiales bacterium]